MGRPRAGARDEALAGLDEAWAALVEAHGPCTLRRRRSPTPLANLVRTIVAQRVSTKAAATVRARLEERIGGSYAADRLLATPLADLRGVGLPERKALAIHAIAEATQDGRLPLERLGRWSDARIEGALSALPGVGPWTAQVFMIFDLARPDVFPAADLGVQEGIRRAYGLEARPSAREARERAEAWAPYRSAAAWYLWRACDTTPGGEA